MQRLGRYTLTHRLGQGGAGTVYGATLHGPGDYEKPVALKLLEDGGDGLRREARLGGLLRHRHLVDVYEIGEVDGQWFCAMELCDRGALAAHMPLPPRAVVDVGLQVCQALAYAHDELGLVHLDLKPDNLLLSRAGEVKVADLGIARAEGFAGDGRIRGTPRYMAPEQRRGQPVDARTDIYALGLTLVELATTGDGAPSGTLDLDSLDDLDDPEGSATLDWSDTVDPDPPTQEVVTGSGPMYAPEWLAGVAARCTAPDRDDRFPSMRALAEALSELRAGLAGPGLVEALGGAPGPERQARDTNLGPPDHGFVGREGELAWLAEAMSTPGSWTLRGMGGMGKSRLAREAARAWRATHGGPAWFVDLAAASTPADLCAAVAATLGVPLGKGDAEVRLGHALAGWGPMVLVLDNLEQLDGAAPLLERWARAAPECRFLLTSRTPVGLSDERTLQLSPLGTEASRALLIDRAARRGADVREAPALDALAESLHGLPLALELAAGRLGVLSVAEVLERLGRGILRSGTDGRHATLEAALQWSWDLLTSDEQRALVQLTAFDGGATLAAAERVLDLAGEVTDALDGLLRHSLVRLEDDRVVLLARVREFATAKASPLEAERRHGAFFAAMGTEAALEALDGPGSEAGYARYRDELPNLVVACTRAVERGEGEVAALLARAAWIITELVGPYTRGLAQLDAAAAIAPDPRWAALDAVWACSLMGQGREAAARAEALLPKTSAGRQRSCALRRLANAQRISGELTAAEDSACAALAEARRIRDRRAERDALNVLALTCSQQSRLDEARAHLEAELAIARDFGRRGLGTAHVNLSSMCHLRGDYEGAHAHLVAYLEIARAFGDAGAESAAMGNLGLVFKAWGRLDEARVHYEAQRTMARRVGDLRGEANATGNLGTLLLRALRLPEAIAHYEAYRAISERLGDVRAVAIGQVNLASARMEAGETDAARVDLLQALTGFEAVGDQVLLAHTRAELARLVPPEDGLALLRQAEEPLRAVRVSSLLATLLAAKAEVLHRLGRPGAEAALAEAAELSPEDPEVKRAVERARATLALPAAGGPETDR